MSRLYDLRRWRRQSRAFLQANPLCAMCTALGKTTLAVLVDGGSGLGYLSSTVMERLPNIVGWGGMFSLEPGHWVPGPNFFSYEAV